MNDDRAELIASRGNAFVMLVEMRTYTLHPGKLGAFLRHYEAEGLAVQRRILGHMVGYFTSESGVLNQVVHLWAYSDLRDRAERRAELESDQGWQAYLSNVLPLIHLMESKVLVPTGFSPAP